MMSRTTSPAIAFLAVALGAAVHLADASQVRKLGWDDLLPAGLLDAGRAAFELEDRIMALADDEREIYETVGAELLLRRQLAKGDLTEDDLLESDRALLADALSERHPEVVELLDRIVAARMHANSLASAVEPALNGAQVRIPGYVLPLEFEGTRVREFLLVPYVGACIHVPAPPPNQMVFVRTASGFEIPELYAPVWVEGTMTTAGVTRELKLVDGQAPVEAGYTLDADEVVPLED